MRSELIKYESKLEKKYQEEIESIMKEYPQGEERDLILKNLKFQNFASKLALHELISEEKNSNSTLALA